MFVEGQTSGVELAKFRDPNCKKSEEEIAKALQYNGRLDYYFAFKQEQKTHQHLQTQIKEIDAELHKLLQKIINEDNNKKQHVVEVKKYKRKNKNGYKNIDVNDVAYKYFEGVDLMAIEGVNEATIMSIISEVGLDGLKKFNSAKQFTTWLRLAPNNKISGGKVLSHHTPKVSQSEVLFDLLKQELNHPTVFINSSNLFCGQSKIVGYKHILLPIFR